MEPIGQQLSCTIKQGDEVLGYLAIDSLIKGRSGGGLRMTPDLEEAEIVGLARAMTLKFGFLGIVQGGAKAGIRGDPGAPAEVRREKLLAFGQAIAPLLRSRGFAPYTDMGTDRADIHCLLASVGFKVKARELCSTNAGYYTALTVLAGISQGAQQIGLDLSRAKVAIEGFGKVGAALAGLLAERQIPIVAVSSSQGAIYNPRGLDIKRLSELASRLGSRFVDAYEDAEHMECSALLELPVDVLCPCARHGSIHSGNARRITAKLISSGANNPVEPEAEALLAEQPVLCLPDFVTNSGGALGGSMEFAMHHRQTIESFIEQRIGSRISQLLRDSQRLNIPLRELAEREARDRFVQMEQVAARRPVQGRLIDLGLECHQRGWVPGPLMRRLSMSFFDQALSQPAAVDVP
jgi:glutamate dehydrogenase/leucine dehydrogenase